MFPMIHLTYIFKNEMKQIESGECLNVITNDVLKASRKLGIYLST